MIERRPHWWLPVGLVAVISLPSYGADSSVPALLQFAEHYQNPKAASARPLAETKAPPAPVKKPAESESIKKLHQLDASLRANLRKKEQQLQRQQSEIKALQSQLAALKKQPAENVVAEPKTDAAAGLSQLIQGVRQGFQRPPAQQKAADLLSVARQERAQALAEAQQAKQANQTLRQQLNQLQSKTDKDVAISQDSVDKRIQSLSHQLQDLQKQRQQTEAQLAALQKDHAQTLLVAKQEQQNNQALRQQLNELQSKNDKGAVTAKNALEKNTESLTKQLQDAQKQQQQTAEQLVAVQKDRTQAQADVKQAQQDAQTSRQQLADLKSKAEKDLAAAQKGSETATASLTKQLQDAQKQQQQTAEQLAAVQKDRTQAQTDAKQAQQDNQALRQQLTVLQSKSDKDVVAAQTSLEKTTQSLTKQLQDAQKQQQQSAEQLASVQKDRTQAQADAKQAQQDVQALRQQLTVLQSKSDKDVVAAQASLEKTTQSLTTQLQDAQKQQQQTAEQLAAVQKDRTQAQADAKQAQQDAQTSRQQLADLKSNAEKDLAAAQKGSETATASLTKQLQDAQKQLQQSTDLLGEKDKTLAQFEKDIQGLKGALALLQPDVKMTTPKDKQSYAAGVALGKNVLEVQAEQASIGVPTDRKLLLTGIVDSFNGSYKLAPDALAKAMRDTDKEVFQAKKKNTTLQKTMSESYLSKFSKKKGSQKADSGFWYHIDYAGDDKIPEGAVLDVVVQESLTDGTIIQDMDVNGSVLSQSLDRYPPLFREALSKLKNHGTITMVVPPELAYGDKGYPPKIPPNSTMVYVVRIVDIIPVKK